MATIEYYRRCCYPTITAENCENCDSIFQKHKNHTRHFKFCVLCKNNINEEDDEISKQKIHDIYHTNLSFICIRNTHYRCATKIRVGEYFCEQHNTQELKKQTQKHKKQTQKLRQSHFDKSVIRLSFCQELVIRHCPNDLLIDNIYYDILCGCKLPFYITDNKKNRIKFSYNKFIITNKSKTKTSIFSLNLFVSLPTELQLCILKKLSSLDILLLFMIVHPLRTIIRSFSPSNISSEFFLNCFIGYTRCVYAYFHCNQPIKMSIFNYPLWYDNITPRERDINFEKKFQESQDKNKERIEQRW